MTPLMAAALYGADQVISLLLSREADPDRTDQHGGTPLILAIQSGVVPTIETLAELTNKELGRALYNLARERVEVHSGFDPLDPPNLAILRLRIFKSAGHFCGASYSKRETIPETAMTRPFKCRVYRF